jgi:hypothetical protein
VASCQDAAVAPTEPSPVAIAMPGELQHAGAPPETVATAGYLIVGADGAFLADSVLFDRDGTIHPLATGVSPIWLGAEAADALGGALHSAGGVRYAPVLARGRWEGPGAYGAAGKYRYQLVSARLERLSVQDATVGELIDRPTSYDGRLIRVAGGLLVHEQSALLVDRLGPGGVPAPDARQVKLRAPLADRALLDRLKGPVSGAVRFGQVQVEGFWHAGALAPLSISIIT